MNNARTSEDLFDLMSRWDTEVKEIPTYLLRQGATLTPNARKSLLVRRGVLKQMIEELRDAMANMTARYRGVVDGVVVIEADTEDACWAKVHNQGVVEFTLLTQWAETDRSIDHRSPQI